MSGPASFPNLFAVSPVRGRVAVVVTSGSRQTVRIDDEVLTELYDEIVPFRPPKGQTSGTAAFVFSRNGERYGFIGKKGPAYYLVVDGKPGPELETPGLAADESFMFSPDSKHFAYIARLPRSNGGPGDPPGALADATQTVMLDGVAGPAFAGISALQFSPDGAHIAYVGSTPAVNTLPTAVMVDGKEVGRCQGVERLSYSVDGARFAYICGEAGAKRVVVNGKPDAMAYGTITDLQWSRTGSHYAYVGTRNPNDGSGMVHEVVVDGAVKSTRSTNQQSGSRRVIGISQLSLSPDGLRYAYIMATPSNSFAVVDGKESLEYGSVMALRFSKDGRHTAAAVLSPNGSFLVFDGEEVAVPGNYGATFMDWFFVDLPGPLYAYPRKVGDQWKVVVEGGGEPLTTDIELKGDLPTGPTNLIFSADGRRYVMPGMGRSVDLAVNGKALPGVSAAGFTREGGTRTSLPTPFAVFSPDSKYLAFVATTTMASGQRANELFLNESHTPGEAIGGFGLPRFSADSRHFAYFAMTKGAPGALKPALRVFVDGRPGPVVDTLFPEVPESFGFLADGRLQFLALKNSQLQRYIVDTSGSTVSDFASNANASSSSGVLPVKQTSNPTDKPGIPQNGKTPEVKDPAGAATGKIQDAIKKRLPGILR